MKRGYKRKVPVDPLERSIYLREAGIARMRENIKKVRARAEEEVRAIEKRIVEKQVLLDALKRGKLK